MQTQMVVARERSEKEKFILISFSKCVYERQNSRSFVPIPKMGIVPMFCFVKQPFNFNYFLLPAPESSSSFLFYSVDSKFKHNRISAQTHTHTHAQPHPPKPLVHNIFTLLNKKTNQDQRMKQQSSQCWIRVTVSWFPIYLYQQVK